MKRAAIIVFIVGMVMATAGAIGASAARGLSVVRESLAQDPETTYTLCHKPGIEDDTITIPEAALTAHLDHGDVLGACELVSATATLTVTVTVSPTATVTPTSTTAPTATPSPTATLSPTVTVSPTVTITPTQPISSTAIPAAKKITICHKPGKIDNTLSVSVNALNAHLAHGDTEGECIQAEPDPVIASATPPAESTSVTICHKPGKANKTMQVPESALNGHLGHGDAEGSCP